LTQAFQHLPLPGCQAALRRFDRACHTPRPQYLVRAGCRT
jgi:hypothetical protein